MKVFFTIVFVIILLSDCAEKRNQKERLRINHEFQETIQQTKISQVILYNADTTWINYLLGARTIRSGTFKTIELEKAWLRNNPILFDGYINDISNYDDNSYLLEFGFSTFLTELFGDQNVFLQVKFPKAEIDSLIREHPQLINDDFFGKYNQRILVVAKIEAISKTNVFDKEGYTKVMYGKGEGLSINIFIENEHSRSIKPK